MPFLWGHFQKAVRLRRGPEARDTTAQSLLASLISRRSTVLLVPEPRGLVRRSVASSEDLGRHLAAAFLPQQCPGKRRKDWPLGRGRWRQGEPWESKTIKRMV